jgi:TPR repeat protein
MRVASLSCLLVVGSVTAFGATPEATPDRFRQAQAMKSTSGLQALATAGDADAAYSLGSAYNDGRGVPRNPRLAAEWFERAAMQDHVEAQFSLGFLYLHGSGAGELALEPDEAKARTWLGRAARAGQLDAQALAGSLLLADQLLVKRREQLSCFQPPGVGSPRRFSMLDSCRCANPYPGDVGAH